MNPAQIISHSLDACDGTHLPGQDHHPNQPIRKVSLLTALLLHRKKLRPRREKHLNRVRDGGAGPQTQVGLLTKPMVFPHGAPIRIMCHQFDSHQ